MKVTASSFNFLTNREFHMTQNIGNIERIIRIVGGLVLVALAATGTVGVWGWLGLVPLATGLTGWCPPYSLLGINTCKNKNT
jgi:hypothetical protein